MDLLSSNRDLAALSILSTTWRDRDPPGIADDLATALASIVNPEFIATTSLGDGREGYRSGLDAVCSLGLQQCDRRGPCPSARSTGGFLRALSPREHEVLAGLLAGLHNKTIAYDLNISVRTVEVHRARLMERLRVQTFAEVIRLGVLASLR